MQVMNIVQERQAAVSRITAGTLQYITRLCYSRIQFVISTNPNATETIFRIPPFIVGYPVVDQGIAMRHLAEILHRDRFQVSQVDNERILIRWTGARPVASSSSPRTPVAARSESRRPVRSHRSSNSILNISHYEILLNK